MNKAMIFNFEVDKENRKIRVERSFDAPLDLVWSAWTEAVLLDQWWAPKPWKAETKSMEFSEGGRWLYAMVGPEGERHWALMEYESIAPKKSFSSRDAFADQDGKVDGALPASAWVNSFSESGGTTTVTNVIRFDDLAQLESLIQMGFKEGFTMGLENLEELLARMKPATRGNAPSQS
jgi:uncharacterized protein YndB with AHSA1/START domain